MKAPGARHRRLGGPEDGTAPTIALVHGMEASWRSWQRLAARLDPGWTTIALDLPWRTGGNYRWGRSGTPGDWVANAVAELPERPAILVGHSFGATAVLEALSHHPTGELTEVAVLLAPFYCEPEHSPTWETFDECRIAFERLITDTLRTWLKRHGGSDDPQLLSRMASNLGNRIGPLAFTEWFRQFAASGQLELASVSTRTLVLTGPADLGLRHGRAAALAAAMPAAEVRQVPEYDHFYHVRRPGWVAEAIEEFAAAQLCQATAGDAQHAGQIRQGHRL